MIPGYCSNRHSYPEMTAKKETKSKKEEKK